MLTREPLTAGQDVAALVRTHADVVWRYAMGMLRNTADADDATQETFLRVHRAMDTYTGDAAVRTWIIAICRNVCLDLLRRRRDHVALDERTHGGADTDADPASAVPILASIRDGMDELPDHLREAFVLVDVLGLSGVEAADVCGVAPTTLRSRLQRAHGRLVDHLTGGAHDGM